MNTEKSLGYEIKYETEKDCGRCSQVLGSNPECDACNKASGRSPTEIESLISIRRKQDERFGLRKRSRHKF